jgi:hypothetical protein
MNLQESLKLTAEMYAKRGIATVRNTNEGDPDDLDWSGRILDDSGQPSRPCGLVVATTTQPTAELEMVVYADGDAVEPGTVSYGALDMAAGFVTFQRGRGGLLWLNAGEPRILGQAALANAVRRMHAQLEREENDGPRMVAPRRILWSQCVAVPMFKHRKNLILDWLAGCLGQMDSDSLEAAESQAAASPGTGQTEPDTNARSVPDTTPGEIGP